jgi:hypothetical protein
VRADALAFPFPNDAFDLVSSWGVLHHTGAIDTAVAKVRCLGALGRLLGGRPLQGLKRVVADHVESPGTLSLTVPESHRLLAAFDRVWSARTGTGSSFPVWAGSQAHGSAGSL